MDGDLVQPRTRQRSLSLVIPAYNEEAGIRQAVEEADEALRGLVAAYEILVVDDGSGDGTASVVRELADARPCVRLLRHPENRGYGAALRTGFAAARFDRVAFTDADCQFYLEDLAPLLDLTDRGPVAVGYRQDRQDPWRRRFLSRGYNVLVRALLGTGVRDCDCALKVFHREALGRLLPETTGFFVNGEMLARARQLGYGVAEAGVRHRPRARGASKVSLGDVPRTLATLLPFWWSQLLFPAWRPAAPDSAAKPRAVDFGLCLVILAAALLCFARLGCPLQEPEEARYAEIPRQMLEQGSYLVPVLDGLPYQDKPPLLYWLVMVGYALFGVHDWSAHLVSATAVFLTVLTTYAWGRGTVGRRPALLGAFLLCCSLRFLYLGRLVTMNGLLCCWVTASWAAAHRATDGARLGRGWWLLSACACGLGVLTKGPVALVLAAAPLLAHRVLEPRAARPSWRNWAGYLALVLGIAGPWYVWMAGAEGGFGWYFLWRHNVLRYLAPWDHEGPVWFYLPTLLAGMLPGSLLLPALVRYLARRRGPLAARRPAGLGFYLLASLSCLVFFSLAGCKRSGYILPAMPPLALALGCYLQVLLPDGWDGELLARRGAALAHGFSRLVLGLTAVAALAAAAAGVVRPGDGLGVAVVSAAVWLWLRGRGAALRPQAAWCVCGATTFALLLVAVHVAWPAQARRFSLRGCLRPHGDLSGRERLPVFSYPRRWDSVSFYLRRSDVRAYGKGQREALIAQLRDVPEALLVVKSDGSLADLLDALPPALEFVPQGRRGTVTVGRVRRRPEAPAFLLAAE